MDIGLLSKMIHELLMGNDKVGLPGMGSFVAEFVPASFSDKGYAINPPYRRVVFLPGPGNDGLLAAHLAKIAGIGETQALDVLQKYLAELKAELIERKTVVFPELGRLRATKQNNFFFICDEELDIYPEGFGLQSVSLKTHTGALPAFDIPDVEPATIVAPEIPLVDTSADIPAVDQPIPAVEPWAPAEEPVAEPVAEPAPEPASEQAPEPAVEPAPEPAPAPVAKPERRRSSGKAKKIIARILLTILVLAAVAAVALVTFLILVQAAPDFIDSILYTPEELRIINW